MLANKRLLLRLVDPNQSPDFCLTKNSGTLKMGLKDTRQFLHMSQAYIASLFSVLAISENGVPSHHWKCLSNIFWAKYISSL